MSRFLRLPIDPADARFKTEPAPRWPRIGAHWAVINRDWILAVTPTDNGNCLIHYAFETPEAIACDIPLEAVLAMLDAP